MAETGNMNWVMGTETGQGQAGEDWDWLGKETKLWASCVFLIV